MKLLHSARMRRLPPFDALIAFEAALRSRSMTAAAAELGLTQSAVSHRVRRLEAFIGTALLRRQSAGLLPTPAGEALAEGLAGLLDGMADLRTRCLAAAAPGRLRVGVGAALAENWLVRRLPGFAAAYPEISVELVVVENEAPERTTDLDLRILWVPVAEHRATSTQAPLFRESVFPVSHPSLLPPGFTPGAMPACCRGCRCYTRDRRGARPVPNGPGRRGSTGWACRRGRRKASASRRLARLLRRRWKVRASCWRAPCWYTTRWRMAASCASCRRSLMCRRARRISRAGQRRCAATRASRAWCPGLLSERRKPLRRRGRATASPPSSPS